MAIVLDNISVGRDVHLMKLGDIAPGKAGQFYMLRHAEAFDPFFGRPISLFDYDEEEGTAWFLYRTVGRGTRMLAAMPAGERMDAHGPYGNGFSVQSGNAVLIGGGIGVAPLHLLLKTLRKAHSDRHITVYLGYREEVYMADAFRPYANKLLIKVGGAIMDDVEFSSFATYYACGPEPMLQDAAHRAEEVRAKLFVSSEAHMACGVGVCLGCTCKTKSGNKRVCKDGPVFPAEELYCL